MGSKERPVFSGRGGAGNIKPSSPSLAPVDLSTPHLKAPHYTTGRGGTGNMASNDPAKPSLARQAQDVDVPSSMLDKKEEKAEWRHWGRGGEGNLTRGKSDGTIETVGSKGAATGAAGPVKEKKGPAEKAKEVMGAALQRVRSNEAR